MSNLRVQGAPNLYFCEEGALEKLRDVLSDKPFSKGVLIHGTKSWEAAKEYIEPLQLNVTKVHYNGECSQEEVKRLKAFAQTEGADYILGVGGGKVLDLAKAAAHILHLPYILVPTLASNCAPWTPLSVFYDEAGNFTNYEVFSDNAFMVALEPAIIIDSPEEFLRAGIGDTLAKWYEADVLTRHLDPKPLAVEIGVHAARLCHDVLIDEGKAAIEALNQRKISPSFVRVIETIIMAGGMVGGYGERYGRIAGAHSIHNGMTTLPETHQHLHGDKVAYGILAQLALEERFDEIKKLLPYYSDLNIPASLRDLGIKHNLEDAFKKIAAASTKEGESIHFMDTSTSAEALEEALKKLESFVSQQNKVDSV